MSVKGGTTVMRAMLWSLVMAALVIACATPAQSATGSDEQTAVAAVPLLLFQLKFAPETIGGEVFEKLTGEQIKQDRGLNAVRLQNSRSQIDQWRHNIKLAKARGLPSSNITMLQERIQDQEAQIAKIKAGMVFDKATLEQAGAYGTTGLDFATHKLAPEFERAVRSTVDKVPTEYVLRFEVPAYQYRYDYEHSVLVNAQSTWSPCEQIPGKGCLPDGRGSHFFIDAKSLLDQGRIEWFKGLGGYYLFRPPPTGRLTLEGVPSAVAHRRNGAYIALDHVLAMPYLKLPQGKAQAFLNKLQAAGSVVATVRVRLVGLKMAGSPDRPLPALVAHLESAKVAFKGGEVITVLDPDSLQSAAQRNHQMVAAQAAAEKKARIEAKQQAKVQTAQRARYSNMDVLGIKLGMTFEEADRLARSSVKPTTIVAYHADYHPARFSQAPFSRSVLYLRLPTDDSATTRESARYWRVVRADEALALAIQKSPKGHDVVVGIWRSTAIPANASLESVRHSLLGKYGDAAQKTQSDRNLHMAWGRNLSSRCQPRGKKYGGRGGKLIEGVDIPRAANRLWNSVVPSVAVPANVRWQDLPKEIGIEDCGPVVVADASTGSNSAVLTIGFADYADYFADFARRFIKETENVHVDL